tara:strand:- start:2165 stop:2413 length:249 start_codon:yes stop_codon:yes gene_type:complete
MRDRLPEPPSCLREERFVGGHALTHHRRRRERCPLIGDHVRRAARVGHTQESPRLETHSARHVRTPYEQSAGRTPFLETSLS